MKPAANPVARFNVTRGESVKRATGFAAGFKNVCYSHSFDDFSTARVRLVRERGEPVAYVLTAAAEVGQGIVLVCEQIARTELGVQKVVIETPNTSIGSGVATRSITPGGSTSLAWSRPRMSRTRVRATLHSKATPPITVTSRSAPIRGS